MTAPTIYLPFSRTLGRYNWGTGYKIESRAACEDLCAALDRRSCGMNHGVTDWEPRELRPVESDAEPEQASEGGGRRLTMDLTPAAAAEIERLRESTGLSTADLFRQAISAYRLQVNDAREGGKGE